MDNEEFKPISYLHLDFKNRLETYRNWPAYHHPRSLDLAKAGFYYTNFSDHCKCFYCGIVLGDWSPRDSAWKEHALHSPHCLYVKMYYFDAIIDLPLYAILPSHIKRR